MDILHATKDYGEELGEDHRVGICKYPGCTEPLTKPGAVVCKKHVPNLRAVRRKMHRLCELAKERQHV